VFLADVSEATDVSNLVFFGHASILWAQRLIKSELAVRSGYE
jgi:hypothetical protein